MSNLNSVLSAYGLKAEYNPFPLEVALPDTALDARIVAEKELGIVPAKPVNVAIVEESGDHRDENMVIVGEPEVEA